MTGGPGQTLYLVAADIVLFVHALFVAFVVLGLAMILIGGARAWRWVRDPWFRAAHLVAIGFVVAQSWLGSSCPLTTLESALRVRAGDAAYTGGFVAHWIEAALYYRAPEWVFVLVYTAFGVVVVASWFLVGPRRFGRRP